MQYIEVTGHAHFLRNCYDCKKAVYHLLEDFEWLSPGTDYYFREYCLLYFATAYLQGRNAGEKTTFLTGGWRLQNVVSWNKSGLCTNLFPRNLNI